MPKERLKELVEQLNHELEQAGAADPDTRARLSSLRDEIDEALSRDRPAPEIPHTLRERIQNEIEEFERTHPTLVARLDSVLRALADVGI